LHNEALADRNWELKEAEERAAAVRIAGRPHVLALRRRITFVNDAYCELARQSRRC